VQSLAGLSAIHARGIIHRDLKPSNIYLKREDGGTICAQILDFGAAALDKRIAPCGGEFVTETGAGPCTMKYAAPEQLREGGGDQRIDIYALGVTLYEALCGVLPQAAARAEKAVVRAARLSHVPLALRHVIAKAMADDPNERYASAVEFANALRPFSVPRPSAWFTRVVVLLCLAITATVVLQRDFIGPLWTKLYWVQHSGGLETALLVGERGGPDARPSATEELRGIQSAPLDPWRALRTVAGAARELEGVAVLVALSMMFIGRRRTLAQNRQLVASVRELQVEVAALRARDTSRFGTDATTLENRQRSRSAWPVRKLPPPQPKGDPDSHPATQPSFARADGSSGRQRAISAKSCN